ncbi:hypothetical protein [Nocardia sp. NPDC052566]|uniref:hypothetical protein n=1 Tax=Nocardia sp. NPDC052566 TaxID=3364330 RepID=UPI0037CB6481
MATTTFAATAPTRHRIPTIEVPRGARLHRPLLWMVYLMATLVLVCTVGMVVDDRLLLGESVWLKPFKFGLAFVLYGFTLAWLLSLPHKGSRATWWMGTIFAVTGIADVGFIVVQAARGTYSHFNNSETDMFNVIGQKIFMSGVPGLFLANLVIVLILSWQRVVDRPTARAIHAGLALAVVGMALGYLMGFTGKQLVRDADGNVVELVAGHTVAGEADVSLAPRDAMGGMPITHWSTVGGDLRIPHFLGLHGIQVLLFAAFALAFAARRYRWLRSERTRAALVGILAVGYAGLLAISFWQAMRAQSLVHPDRDTLLAVGGLTAGVAVLLGAVCLTVRAKGRVAETDQRATLPVTAGTEH